MSLRLDLARAMPLGVGLGLLFVLPLIWLAFQKANGRDTAPQAKKVLTRPADGKHGLRSWRFWSVRLPFALALAAQAGLVVYLVSLLLPALGPAASGAALALISFAARRGV